MDTALKQSMGSVLKAHRLANGLTMQQLCLMCDINRLTLRKIENGTGNPTIDILMRVSEGLGLSLIEVVTEAGCRTGSVTKREIDGHSAFFIAPL